MPWSAVLAPCNILHRVTSAGEGSYAAGQPGLGRRMPAHLEEGNLLQTVGCGGER